MKATKEIKREMLTKAGEMGHHSQLVMTGDNAYDYIILVVDEKAVYVDWDISSEEANDIAERFVNRELTSADIIGEDVYDADSELHKNWNYKKVLA